MWSPLLEVGGKGEEQGKERGQGCAPDRAKSDRALDLAQHKELLVPKSVP